MCIVPRPAGCRIRCPRLCKQVEEEKGVGAQKSGISGNSTDYTISAKESSLVWGKSRACRRPQRQRGLQHFACILLGKKRTSHHREKKNAELRLTRGRRPVSDGRASGRPRKECPWSERALWRRAPEGGGGGGSQKKRRQPEAISCRSGEIKKKSACHWSFGRLLKNWPAALRKKWGGEKKEESRPRRPGTAPRLIMRRGAKKRKGVKG